MYGTNINHQQPQTLWKIKQKQRSTIKDTAEWGLVNNERNKHDILLSETVN